MIIKVSSKANLEWPKISHLPLDMLPPPPPLPPTPPPPLSALTKQPLYRREIKFNTSCNNTLLYPILSFPNMSESVLRFSLLSAEHCRFPEFVLGLRTQDGFIQQKKYTWKYYIRSTLQNNTNMLNKYGPDIIKKSRKACWETSTKVIADRLRRGHPGRGGVQRSVVGIWK